MAENRSREVGFYKTSTMTGIDASKSNDPITGTGRVPRNEVKEGLEGKHTDERNVHSTFGQWPTFSRPSQTVLQYPSIEVVLRFLRKTKVRRSDALKNIVVVLRRPEY